MRSGGGGERLDGVEQFKGAWHGSDKGIATEEWAAIRAISKGERSFNEIIDIECFDGKRKTILNSAVPVVGPDNEIMGAVVVNSDISSIKLSEKQLERERDKLKAVLDGMTDGVVIISPSHDVEFVNRKVLLEFGPPDGKKCYDYFGGSRQGCPWGQDRERFPAATITWEWWLQQDGRFFEIIDMPLINSDGTVSLLEIMHDVTARKKSEEQIRLLSHAVEQSPTAVIITDTSGKIQYANSKFTQLTGYEAREVIGKSPGILKSGKTLESEYRSLWKTILAGGEWRGEFLNKRRSGELYWESGCISPLSDEYGNITHFIAIKEDVTARKETEQELLHSRQQLRTLNERIQIVREEERAHIAREVHDELGQNLSVMRLDVSWLRSRFGDLYPQFQEKTKELLQTIDDTINSIQRITSELRPGVLDKLGLIPAIEWQAHEFGKRTGIVCNLRLPRSDIVIETHRTTALFRIFQESLTNVLRHAQATEIKVTLIVRRGSLTLTIADNGRGITRKEINDPSSLGLLGIRERVLVWHGTTTMRGRVGVGTTISVTIPVD